MLALDQGKLHDKLADAAMMAVRGVIAEARKQLEDARGAGL